MKLSRKNILKTASCSLLTLLLLVGCSNTGTSNGAEETAETETQQAESSDSGENVETSSSEDSSEEADNSSGTANQEGSKTEFEKASEQMYAALEPLPSKDTDANLAAIVSDLSNPFWVTMQSGYEDGAKEFGAEINIQASEDSSDTSGQLDLLNNLLVQDFDAIAVSPLTEDNLVPGIVTANEENVPIVSSGTQVSQEALESADAEVDSQIIVDFYQQGVLGAEYIVDQHNGEGAVAVIAGVEGGTNGDGRRDGAVDTFEAAGMEVVSVVQADFDAQKAYEAASNIIQSNPDIKGFACGNDEMAMGVVQALEENDMVDKVTVVGVDFAEEGKAGIKEGKLDATVAMSPYLMGIETSIIMLKALQGDDVSELGDKTPMALVTSENVDNLEDWK